MGMNKFSGNIKIFNQDVPSLKLCKQIGYMAQNDALYEDLAVMDNLLFFSSMFGLKGKEASRRANEMLDLVDLQKDKKKLVKNFSGGISINSLGLCIRHIANESLRFSYGQLKAMSSKSNVLLAAGSLALGTLLSAFERNEFQLFQFIPIVIVPQVLFCGLFDLRGAPTWVIALSKIFPLTYAADALTDVVLRGFDISYICFDLIILVCYTVAFLALNSLALKKYRRL
ncbi:hypothetical protein CCDG5_0327 [[Clostridium] cellulosi]|uniref:ABC-2 type transporter transmembrane domain-containing protein n=1 Tax=[Clostridium] cellulosi TaxID=29343 RepID=A0A078KQS1_9FIRM|nr:hypothetical protein CCDG5_0327 [[Clostridium] cellulosi]